MASNPNSIDSIISTDDVRVHHKYEHLFPDRQGIWMYGSLEKGLAHIHSEMTSGLNVKSNVRSVLLSLRDEYQAVRRIYLRQQARSDETQHQQSAVGRLGRMVQTICDLEILLLSYQRSARLIAERLHLSDDFARAISDIGVFKFYATYGDYLAIINQEIKTNNFFIHRTTSAFRGKTLDTTTKLVAAIEAEEDSKRSDPDAETPVLDSIDKAFEFVNDIFTNPKEIITCFKAYSTRNEKFHTGVKDMAEEGRLPDLYACLVRDRALLDYLDITPEMKDEGLLVIDAVGNTFFASWDKDNGTGYVPSALGIARFERGMKKRQAAGEKLSANTVTKDPEKEKALLENLREKKRIASREVDILVEQDSRRRRYESISSFSEELETVKANDMLQQLRDLQVDHDATMKALQETQKQLDIQMASARRSAENNKEIKKRKDAEINDLKWQVSRLRFFCAALACTLVVVILKCKK